MIMPLRPVRLDMKLSQSDISGWSPQPETGMDQADLGCRKGGPLDLIDRARLDHTRIGSVQSGPSLNCVSSVWLIPELSLFWQAHTLPAPNPFCGLFGVAHTQNSVFSTPIFCATPSKTLALISAKETIRTNQSIEVQLNTLARPLQPKNIWALKGSFL